MPNTPLSSSPPAEALAPANAASHPTETIATIPVFAETARVGTREVETERTLIHKSVVHTDEVIEALLARHDVSIERIEIDRVVEHAPAARQDGDCWVFPVVEERLVVEKRLVLKEEIWVRIQTTQESVSRTVRLRHEKVDVTTARAEEGNVPEPSGS